MLLSSKRSVDDALRDLRAGNVNPREMSAALDSVVAAPVDGVTVEVSTPMGKIVVDKAGFAQKAGLSLQVETDIAFSVFLKYVPNRLDPEDAYRKFLVIVRGAGSNLRAVAETAPFPADFFSALEERSKSYFDMPASADLPGVADGWELLSMDRFNEALGWLRGGYTYVVKRNAEGGLNFSY